MVEKPSSETRSSGNAANRITRDPPFMLHAFFPALLASFIQNLFFSSWISPMFSPASCLTFILSRFHWICFLFSCVCPYQLAKGLFTMCFASHGYEHHILLCNFVLPVWAVSSGGKNMHSVQGRAWNLDYFHTNKLPPISARSECNLQHTITVRKPKPCYSKLCAWARAKTFGSSWLWMPSLWHHIHMGPSMASEVFVLLPPQEQTVLQDSGNTQTYLTCCHISRSGELPLRTFMWLAKRTWEQDAIVLHVAPTSSPQKRKEYTGWSPDNWKRKGTTKTGGAVMSCIALVWGRHQKGRKEDPSLKHHSLTLPRSHLVVWVRLKGDSSVCGGL